MASGSPNDDTTNTRRPTKSFEVLEFEKPILEMEQTILDFEERSRKTGIDLNGQIDGLKNQLDKRVKEVFRTLSPWQRVQVARTPTRPLSSDYLTGMCDEFVELHGDRVFGEDRALITGLARIGTKRVLLVAHRKGRDMKERIQCHFGCAHPEGYRKALRKMRMAEKFGLPIITLINTPGAYPGIGAEERGQAWAIAENLEAMFGLRVPIVCVVIGEGGSGGALGVGIGDRVLMLQHSYYSVISPEGCAAILWNDAKRAPEAALALKLCANDLKSLGVIDEIIEEPSGAAHRQPQIMVRTVRERVLAHLEELERLPISELLDRRYEKFRAMGTEFLVAEPLSVAVEPEIVPPEGQGGA